MCEQRAAAQGVDDQLGRRLPTRADVAVPPSRSTPRRVCGHVRCVDGGSGAVNDDDEAPQQRTLPVRRRPDASMSDRRETDAPIPP